MHAPSWYSRGKRWYAAVAATTIMVIAVLLISTQGATAAPPNPNDATTHADHHQMAMPQASAQRPQPVPDRMNNRGPWFDISCAAGARLRDDPIVYPGQPGVSHEHQYFGAIGVNAFSTYDQNISSTTTCREQADTASYWVPTLYDEQGVLRSPRRVQAHYYANTSSPTTLRAFPANLRMIAGDSHATTAQPGVVQWLCRNQIDQRPGLPLASNNPPRCNSNQYLSVSINFPDCWDGVNLDSTDHRSHMAYADAQMRCPTTHPVKVPRLMLRITYEDRAFTGGNFTLGDASGMSHALSWTGMHADFWNSWQQSTLEQYVNTCLKRGRNIRASSCQR